MSPCIKVIVRYLVYDELHGNIFVDDPLHDHREVAINDTDIILQ